MDGDFRGDDERGRDAERAGRGMSRGPRLRDAGMQRGQSARAVVDVVEEE